MFRGSSGARVLEAVEATVEVRTHVERTRTGQNADGAHLELHVKEVFELLLTLSAGEWCLHVCLPLRCNKFDL